MIPAARKGDRHACPLPGHGTTAIERGSPDTRINFMNAARVGDACGCGAVITSGFPAMLINGRPMAHVGSQTSHGGVIVSGSPDVFGGFQSNVGMGDIVNFARLGVIRPDGSLDEPRLDALLNDPNLIDKAFSAGAIVDPDAEVGTVKVAECTHPDRMIELAEYIAGEMNRNIHHESVLRIKKQNSYDPMAELRAYMAAPWYQRLTKPNFHSIDQGMKLAALAEWTERVGQNRPWDHKPKIKYGEIGGHWHKQGEYDYFYDIWSNVHYGYVGVAAGFSESLLLDGAGLEQIVSDSAAMASFKKDARGPRRTAGVDGLRAWDDEPDRISITIGINLFQRFPTGGVTAQIVMNEVLSIEVAAWVKGIKKHVC